MNTAASTNKRKPSVPQLAESLKKARTAPTRPRCLHMTATEPRALDCKWNGVYVFAHEFTVMQPNGLTQQLWVVPVTDALPRGRGMLAKVDGLEEALLKKHGVSSSAELRKLERRWGEAKAQSHFALEAYLARQAELQAQRASMTDEQLVFREAKQMAIIAHYEEEFCERHQSTTAQRGYTDEQFVAAGAKQADVMWARMFGGVDELTRKFGPVIRKEACSTDLKRWVGRLAALARPQRKPFLDILVAHGLTTRNLVSMMTDEERVGVMSRVQAMEPGFPPHETADLEAQLVRLRSQSTTC